MVQKSLTIGNYVTLFNTSRLDRWLHKKDSLIVHYSGPNVKESQPRCLAAVPHKPRVSIMAVTLLRCNVSDPLQHWRFGIYTDQYEQMTSRGVRVFTDEHMHGHYVRFLAQVS